ncbi:ubiquitin-associated protein 2-like, partial [Copidosoma floridanum]|uniref:ubiquitin-associated protein 2-like n=1 Tax=Copidosoma floridanum TaxID=29053 RepID=UPI000C6F94EC
NKSDQLRHTQNIDHRINSKEIVWQESIRQVMDLTQRSEDEVIMALHDSDGDLNRAVNDLLEGVSPEWEVKKKKPRQSGPKPTSEHCNPNDNNIDSEDKRQPHSNSLLRIRGRSGHNNRG